MMSSGINLVMTVIGFVVSSLFIVFVCTRLICARIHLAASRLSLRSDLNLLERGLQRQEPVGVSNFPTKKFKDEFFKQANDPRCAVCLADYLEEDTLRILPFCGHSFHATCIDIWLYKQSTCPICRESMRENAEKKRVMQMQPMFSSPIRAQFYEMESTVTQSHHCFNGPQYSARMHVGRQSSPIQEGHFTSEENRPETVERTTEADGVQLSKNPNTIAVDSLCNR